MRLKFVFLHSLQCLPLGHVCCEDGGLSLHPHNTLGPRAEPFRFRADAIDVLASRFCSGPAAVEQGPPDPTSGTCQAAAALQHHAALQPLPTARQEIDPPARLPQLHCSRDRRAREPLRLPPFEQQTCE